MTCPKYNVSGGKASARKKKRVPVTLYNYVTFVVFLKGDLSDLFYQLFIKSFNI